MDASRPRRDPRRRVSRGCSSSRERPRRRPTAITGAVSAVGRHLGDAQRHRQSGRRSDRLVVRVRHLDVVRVEDVDDRSGLGLGQRRRLEVAERARAGDDLSLPARRQELLGHDERRRRALHDRVAARRVTSPATGVGPTTATLGGTVNPNGQSTTWYVEYGTSTSYGTKTPAVDAGSGTVVEGGLDRRQRPVCGQDLPLPARRHELGGNDDRCGRDVRHRRAPDRHDVRRPSSVGSTSATLNGKVDPNGRSTTYFFEYGTTTAYGTKTSSSSAGSGTSATSVSKAVNGLKPGTTYHFRLVATSDAGTVDGWQTRRSRRRARPR